MEGGHEKAENGENERGKRNQIFSFWLYGGKNSPGLQASAITGD